MFAQRLNDLTRDTSGPDGIAALVVTALGPDDSYYICWKTLSGQYKQDSQGLPAPLQEWLFPPDGSTRDLPTLQVVLGRDGEFMASDCNGKLDSDANFGARADGAPPRRLSRAPTMPLPPARRTGSLPLRRSSIDIGKGNGTDGLVGRARAATLTSPVASRGGHAARTIRPGASPALSTGPQPKQGGPSLGWIFGSSRRVRPPSSSVDEMSNETSSAIYRSRRLPIVPTLPPLASRELHHRKESRITMEEPSASKIADDILEYLMPPDNTVPGPAEQASAQTLGTQQQQQQQQQLGPASVPPAPSSPTTPPVSLERRPVSLLRRQMRPLSITTSEDASIMSKDSEGASSPHPTEVTIPTPTIGTAYSPSKEANAEEANGARELRRDSKMGRRPTQRQSVYVDAAVQTEPVQNQTSPFWNHRGGTRSPMCFEFLGVDGEMGWESSLDDAADGWEGYDQIPRLGSMTDFFRSSEYSLGDALY